MRPYKILFLLISVFHLTGWSQNDPMISDLTLVPFRISLSDGAFEVEWSQNTTRSTFQKFNVIQISDIRIEGIDLHIEYTIPERDPGLEYAIGMSIEGADSTLIDSNPKEISLNVSGDRNRVNTLVWRNIIGDVIDPAETYSLLIRTDIYGEICSEEPVLNVAGQLPYYGGAILGLGMIGAGQLYKRQADRSYESYEKLWLNGDENDDALREQADQDRKTAQFLTYAGIGVLGLDAILFYLKNRKHRKDVRRYKAFCVGQSEISIHPRYNSNTKMGFMVRINF